MLARRLMGGGGGWTPGDTETAAWWDPSDASSITLSGSRVTAVVDKSGNGKHLAQHVDRDGPGHANSAFLFAGNQILHCPNSASYFTFLHYGGFGFFCVAKPGNGVLTEINDGTIIGTNYGATAARGCWLGYSDYSVQTQAVSCFVNNAGVDQYVAGSFDTAYSSSYNNTLPLNTVTCVSAVIDPLNATVLQRFRVSSNGNTEIAQSRGPYSAVNSAPPTDLWFGMMRNWVNSTFLNPYTGSIMETIIVKGIPTSDITTKMQGYLAHKWDALLGGTTLVSALPIGHPYKTAKP
jgi:TM2 domain-containing membrane protein YozV